MRVIIEESAVADIDGLVAWLAKDSPQRARTTAEKILQTIERTDTVPRDGAQGARPGDI